MKSFTDIFVQRPVLSLVISVLILIAGIQSLNSLSVRQYPKNDNSIVTISTVYVGASAELVRGFITTPIEQALAGVDGVEYIESKSELSLSQITVRLELNYDGVRALSEITSKVNQVRGDLPPESENPVINVESANRTTALAYLNFSSEILESNQINEYVKRVVQPKLTAIDGVQEAEVFGSRNFAMRIWLNPESMAAHNVSPSQVRRALQANNYLSALGATKGSLVGVNLSADTDLKTVEDFEELVVKSEGESLIRLRDIATVELGVQDSNAVVAFSGDTTIFVGISAMPNANALEVMSKVKTEYGKLLDALPRGMTSTVAYDSTEYIESAIKGVRDTLLETLAIVVIVIFLFLGSLRTVLVPIIAIPISLIGGLFLMELFGFSLNLLTILAIVLSVGLVVDDAIVIVENIQRHVNEGDSPLVAAIRGARELVGPVISTTAVLVAVYLPVGLQGGLTGSLFKEFTFTLAGAVIISSIVALTLSPMMSSKIIPPHNKREKPKGIAKYSTEIFTSAKARYADILTITLAKTWLMVLAWIVIGLIAFVMFWVSSTMNSELAPTEDQGFIFGIVEGSSNTTIDYNTFYALQADKVFDEFPEKEASFQITFPTSGFGGMVLTPWDQRERTSAEIKDELQAKQAKIPGFNMFPILPAALPGGGDFPVEFVITATDDIETILEFAQTLRTRAAQSGMFAFPPKIDTYIDKPQASIKIDRDKVADLGLTLEQVGNDIGIMMGGNYVNRFNISGRSYRVIPQIKRDQRLNPDQLNNIYITGPNNQLIPLSTIATIEYKTVPRALNRFQQQNSVKLSGVAIRPLDTALRFLEEESAKILPESFGINYTGESRQLRQEGNKFVPAFTLALLMIFLVLAAQFNSFRDPLIIILGCIPLAMFGALIFVYLKMPAPIPYWTDGWTTTFNIYSQIGLVTLIGLIAKNGILVVEFANKMQEQGKAKLEAVKMAAITRFRPILMTSVATVAGHFPLTLVTGPGAEARNSIGLVLVGGMAIGTLFTLFVIPSVYMLLSKDYNREQAE